MVTVKGLWHQDLLKQRNRKSLIACEAIMREEVALIGCGGRRQGPRTDGGGRPVLLLLFQNNKVKNVYRKELNAEQTCDLESLRPLSQPPV